MLCRAYDVSARMSSGAAKALQDPECDEDLRTELPPVLWVHVMVFCTNSWTEVLMYSTVCKIWLQASMENPLMHVQPTFKLLEDRGCKALLERCEYLRVINLHTCKITDTGLRDLSKMKYLEIFTLRQVPTVTSAGIQVLGNLQQLKVLRIGCICREEEFGLQLDFVKRLEQLRSLHLCDLQITEWGLSCLLGIKSLVSFGLVRCHGTVTRPVILSLVKHLDKLEEFTCRCNSHSISKEMNIEKILPFLPSPRLLKELDVSWIDNVKACMIRDFCPELMALNCETTTPSALMTDIGVGSVFVLPSHLDEATVFRPKLHLCSLSHPTAHRLRTFHCCVSGPSAS